MKPLSSLDMLVSQLDPVLRATAKKKSGRGVSEKSKSQWAVFTTFLFLRILRMDQTTFRLSSSLTGYKVI